MWLQHRGSLVSAPIGRGEHQVFDIVHGMFVFFKDLSAAQAADEHLRLCTQITCRALRRLIHSTACNGMRARGLFVLFICLFAQNFLWKLCAHTDADKR